MVNLNTIKPKLKSVLAPVIKACPEIHHQYDGIHFLFAATQHCFELSEKTHQPERKIFFLVT